MSSDYVLCVDDDLDFLEFYRQILGHAGYRVECFTNQADALAKMADAPPGVVVTDLMMETLSSGFTFSRAVKENGRFRDVPVIVVTAIGSQRGFNFAPGGPDDLKSMNADAFFDKPVAPEAFLTKVAELLDRRKKGERR